MRNASLSWSLQTLLALFVLNLSALVTVAQAPSIYEDAIQQGLKAIYSQNYEVAAAAFNKLPSIRDFPPAPAVYRELLDSWRAAADPGNPVFVSDFDRDSQLAIDTCLAWIKAHPDDPEGWRYLASAYGQISLFDASIRTSFLDKVRAAHLGLRMHDAIVQAQAKEEVPDPDTDLGLGSFAYFTANLPVVVQPVARIFLGIRKGDRQDGIDRLTDAMHNGPHMKIEAAMALAGAFYAEANYANFQRTLEDNIFSLYPNQLSVRTWQVGGYICANDARSALPAIEKVTAGATWHSFQKGRVALALGDRDGAQKLFAEAIRNFDKDAKDTNGAILTWAFFGLELARGNPNPGANARAAQRDHPAIEPDAIPLADHIFFPPGKCPKPLNH